MKFTDAQLNQVLEDVLASSKYRHVAPDLVSIVARQELEHQKDLKSAIKETRNRLHQSAGAYLNATPPYAKWRAQMEPCESADALQALSLEWMKAHASTNERLPILTNFYCSILANIPAPSSVLDIACGLNPLAFGWMGLHSGIRYIACDIYADMTHFAADFLTKCGAQGAAMQCDCVTNPPTESVDIAFILKFLPVLEQYRRGATLDWLQRINAKRMLISYPTKSLSGRGKGMAENYEKRFLDAMASTSWQIEKYLFENELCFMVTKG